MSRMSASGTVSAVVAAWFVAAAVCWSVDDKPQQSAVTPIAPGGGGSTAQNPQMQGNAPSDCVEIQINVPAGDATEPDESDDYVCLTNAPGLPKIPCRAKLKEAVSTDWSVVLANAPGGGDVRFPEAETITLTLNKDGVTWSNFYISGVVTSSVANDAKIEARQDGKKVGEQDLTVLKVELTHIKFDYQGPDKGTSDGLNILKGYDDDLAHAGNGVGDGEWILDTGRNEPFLYVVDKTVKIKAKFRITPAINTTLEIGADAVGGVFPNVTPRNVSFAGGVSVGDANGYVEFDLSGKSHEFDGDSAKDVAKSVDSWQWKITTGPPTCDINISGPHTNYCVLDVPQTPWYEDTKTHPWVSALDLACVWADGQTTIPNAVSEVTRHVYNSGRFAYDVNNHFRDGVKVKLTECIETINGSVTKDANCEDCANFVVSFGNLLGSDYSNARMGTFSGWPGSWQSFLCNKVCPIGLTLWYQADFDWHRVCWTAACGASDKVFDACLQYDSDGDPSTGNNPPRTATIPTDVVFGSSTWTAPCDTYRECLAESGVSFARCQPDGDAVKRELK